MLRSVVARRMYRLAAVGVSAALVASSVTACSHAAPEVTASEHPRSLEADPNSPLGLPGLIGLEPIVDEDTVVLDAAASPVTTSEIVNAAACAPGDPARVPCEFRLTMSPKPEGLKVGSVLVSGVTDLLPAGLLVTVTKIDGNSVLATEASLGDALRQGEFLVEQQFSEADVRAASLAPGVTATGVGALAATRPLGAGGNTLPQAGAGIGLGFAYTLDHVEIDDGVYADGQVGFDIGCGAYGGLTWEKALGVPVYPNGVYFEAKCGATQDGAITISSTVGASTSTSMTLATFNMDAITFFVGPVPVVLIPTITVSANVSGELSVGMSFGASEHFGATVGINYDDDFHLIKDFSKDFSSSASVGSGRLTASAGVSLGQSLLLYGLAGPQLTEQLYVNLEGKPKGQSPVWCLSGGLRADVSLSLDLKVEQLAYGPAELFNASTQLGCAPNTPPTVKLSTSAASMTVYPASSAQPATITAYTFDEEDGSLPVTWSSDLDGVLGTSNSSAAFSLAGLSIGEHIVTATTTDKDGASASVSIPVSARLAQASITIQAPGGGHSVSGVTGDDVVVTLVGTSPIGLQVSSCLPATWSGGLPVTLVGACNYSVHLSKAGTYTLTAVAADSDGNTASDSITVTVSDPAVGSPPAFSHIAASNTDTSPATQLCAGCLMDPGAHIHLQINFLNAAQSGKNVRYEWTYKRATYSSPGTWTALTGPDAFPNTGSGRNLTAPSEYKTFYTYTFQVKVYDRTSGVLYYTDTSTLTYQGPPA